MVLHLSELTKLSNLSVYTIGCDGVLHLSELTKLSNLKPQITLRLSPSLYYIADIVLILTIQLYINHHQLSSFFHLPHAVIVLVL